MTILILRKKLTQHQLKNKISNIKKIKIMPSYGEKQKPAGKVLDCGCRHLGQRKMESRNSNIKVNLTIDNVEYKGNAVLNANK
jgi:hypothetical protein